MIHEGLESTVLNPVYLTLVSEVRYSNCPGQIFSLTQDPQCLVPKQALYSFYRTRRDESLSEQSVVELGSCSAVDRRAANTLLGYFN